MLFLQGALVMASATISFYFLRYWRLSNDRLFLMFSGAFCLLAMNWLLVALLPQVPGYAHAVRFAAMGLIAAAIIDKNRK
ncbi:MAG: hypothetical protein K0R38_422 [Polyangiaceae bacterium]|jgi:hypothetical protein|nr:hypothetical protein [Polyangiaceae bacterium]